MRADLGTSKEISERRHGVTTQKTIDKCTATRDSGLTFYEFRYTRYIIYSVTKFRSITVMIQLDHS
jgi:hypothetical protein